MPEETMASDLVDGDYLGSYRRFIVDFLDKVNPDDQLPIKTSGYDVSEAEMVGEIIHMTLQYINQQLCPPSLQCYIVKLVIEEIKTTCGKQPKSCGYRQDERTYEPLKLMQAVASKVNEICKRYLENSRLALLPPPPSTPMPLANAYAIRNNRRKMEDRHVILHDLNTIFNIKHDSIASYYAVFDGHGGYQAAAFCAAHLHQYLAESCYYPTDPERALRDAFVTADEVFVQKSRKETHSSGSTAVSALILNRKLYVAWAGDSQAALVKRGIVEQLVNPHRPDRNDERDRVTKMGGTVMHLGMWRVNGNLAVSRAIGDAQYKPYVTGDPEIRCITLDGDEDFLIIGSDGLWDSVSENEAAALVYRDLYINPYNYNSASQRLVDYAKSEGSIDNISVIVVFLSSPSKIISRFPHCVNPLLADVKLDNMEPDNRFLSNANGQYDVNSSFVKQTATNNGSPDAMDDDDSFGNYANKSSNGKHRENGDGVVESKDYDGEEDDEDLGPETDVDALDDVSEPMPTLADVSRELFPEKQQDNCEIYQSEEKMDDERPPSPQATKTNQQALIPETDNVGDSEDSEDEWNYYKIDPNKQKDSAETAAFNSEEKTDNETREEDVEAAAAGAAAPAESSPSETHDFLADEKNDSDSSSEPDSESENRSIALIENEISVEKSDTILLATPAENLTNPENLDKEVPEIIESDKLNDNSNFEDHEEPSNINVHEEDMDFQLNPNAAEFVPVSPTPIISTRMDHLDAPVAGSPLKQTPVMDDITIPSRHEFENEVRNRPCEIEERNSCTNGQLIDNIDDETAIEKSSTTPIFNLDESEISSTKAEFGDESSFLTASEFHRTGVSNLDGSYNDSYGIFDNSNVDPMTKSFGPGDFMPLGNPVDLNAVHDLPDDDSQPDENGPQTIDQDDEKMNLETTETFTENAQINNEKQSNFDTFSNDNIDNIESSSPILTPNSPIKDLHFGDEIVDKKIIDFDTATTETEKIDFDIEKTIEHRDIDFSSSQKIDYENNVTSKLLEMDLEDRGSQDCAFEKCNEKFGNDVDKFDDRLDKFETEMIDKKDDIADFFSSSVPKNDFTEFNAKENLPIDKVSQVDEIDKLAETFGELHAKDDSFNAVPEVPILLNPLDLHVENSQIDKENVNLEDCTDYQMTKAPESPVDILSPFPKQEQKTNPFESTDFSSPNLLIDSSNNHQISHDFDEPREKIEPEIVETNSEICEPSNEFVDTKIEREIAETQSEITESKPEIVETQSEITESKPEIVETQPEITELKPEIVETQPEIAEFEEIKKSQPEITECQEIEQTHQEIEQINPEVEENTEISSEKVEISSTLKLSESLQEFTGLEEQLNPDNSTKISNGLETISPEVEIKNTSNSGESNVEEIVKVESSISPIEDIKKSEISLETKTEKSEKIAEPIIAAVATAAAAGTVAAAATKVTKTSKPSVTKTTTKTGTSTKPTANKSTPTSPTKAATSTRTSTSTAGKKPLSTSSATRPTKLETGKAPLSSKTTSVTAKTTSTASKPATRVSASSPRTKPSPAAISKTSTSIADKKPTTNGESTKSTLAANKTSSTAGKISSKPLVKSSTTRATSSTSSTTTTTAAKTRATSTTTSSSVTKITSKTATGNVGTTTQRPKTAPTGGATSLTAKSKVSSTAKAPINDKQVKETANKQISSSRTSTTTTASKNTRSSVTSSTTSATRRTVGSKTTNSQESSKLSSNSAPQAIPPPIRKPAPITRPGGKTGVVTATNVATAPTTNGKTHTTKTTASTKTKVVVQNGVCTAGQETKIVTSTTTNDDEDVPKKDLSPVEPPTDNQLIIAAD